MTKKNKVDTGGKRLNLFPKEKKKEKPYTVDNKVFDMMEAVADKTNVDITNIGKNKTLGKDTKSIHNALMAAGMTPAYGNVADLVDATLYALEGEFGDAAWSAAAAIPIIGQMVSGKRALKAAKEAGEEMVTLYRGIPEWHPSKHMLTSGKYKGKIVRTGESMVKDGKFVGSGKFARGTYFLQTGRYSPDALWVSSNAAYARSYLRNQKSGRLLEFEVPKSYFKKYFQKTDWSEDMFHGVFDKGIPRQFLKKVHK